MGENLFLIADELPQNIDSEVMGKDEMEDPV